MPTTEKPKAIKVKAKKTRKLSPKKKPPSKVICKKCVEIHGKDTTKSIQCPHCNKIVGCSWHKKGVRHILICKKKIKTPAKKTKKKTTKSTPLVVKEVLKAHSFVGSDDVKYNLTGKQHKFCLEYLSNYGHGADAVVEAKYNVFYKDKQGNVTENVNYNLARVMASENLIKPNIMAFIAMNLAKFGYDDDNVELQHLFLINQNANLPTKQRAISDFYKLKGKYPAEKHEHSGQVELIELTNYGSKPDVKK